MSRPPPDPLPGLSGRGRAVLLVGLHVVLGLLVYEPGLLANGDNAGYMILGEALRSGEGYRDLHLPGSPVHVKFPPLYPLLLAGLGLVGDVQLFKLASLAMTAAAVALTVRLGERWLGPRGGVLAGLLLAANPLLLEYGHHVMSEAPFTALLLLSLFAADRATRPAGGGGDLLAAAESDTARRRWWWVALAAAAGAFLTRSVGLALLLGLTLAPLCRGAQRRSAGAAATTLVVAGGWWVFQRLAAPGRAGYLKEWLMVHPYDPAAGMIGPFGMLERAAANLWTYVSWFFPSAVTGLAEGYAGGGRAVAVIGLALTAVALGGWLARCVPRPGAAEVTTFVYVGILAVWPSLWVDRRFLVPLIPLLVLYLLAGAAEGAAAAAALKDRLAGRGGPEGRSLPGRSSPTPLRGARLLGAAALSLGLLAPSAARLAARAPERVACMLQERPAPGCQDPAFGSFFSAAAWARTHTPGDALFISAKPRLFYLKSDRRSRIHLYSDSADRVVRDIVEGGADYVVVDRLPGIGGTTREYLVPAVEAHPDRFAPVYAGGDPVTRILRVVDDAPSGPAP